MVDISKPIASALAGRYNTAGYPNDVASYGVAVSGNYVYLADMNNGLVILNTGLSGKLTPTPSSTPTTTPTATQTPTSTPTPTVTPTLTSTPTETPTRTQAPTLTLSPNETQIVNPTEKADGFELILSIIALFTLYSFRVKRR